MKRPFVIIGAVCFITAVILSKFSIFTVSVIGFVSLAVFLLSVIFISPKSKHIRIIFLSFAVAAVSASMLLCLNEYASVTEYDSQNVNFTGTVMKCNYKGAYEELEIKAEKVNGVKHSFYIKVYSDNGTGLSQGDIISANAKLSLAGGDENNKTKNSSLADKIYFKAYGLESFSLCGENVFFKAVGKIKNAYRIAVQSYLPNELGAVTLGMTIGEKSGINTYLRNCFNYSGTAHLLVVSGLHLTLWTLFVSNFISALRKRRLLDTAVTVVLIILYSALTGFSVSVVRAGVMLLTIKLARLLNRDSDSLNSLGFAVFAIIIQNPFSVYSVSFLLSAGSVLGLVLFSRRIHTFIYKSKSGRLITKSFIGRLTADSLSVSISVSVFTLPVFILYFDMFPVFSFVSNIFIVELSSVLMVLTVLGVIAHFLSVIPLSKCIFYIAGIITKAIIFFAEKIGMLNFSTVSVRSRYFKVFLVFAVIISTVLMFLLRKRKRARNVIVSSVLIIGFALTSFANTSFELTHPSADIFADSNGICILVRDGVDSVFFGTEKTNANYIAGNMLSRHNLKTIGCIYADDTDIYTFAEIKNITNDYPSRLLAFRENADSRLKCAEYHENVKAVTVNGVISVTPFSSKTAVITCGNSDIFVSSDISCQNLLENNRKYDIIILSADAFNLYGEKAEKYLKNESSQIVSVTEEQITVYPDTEKIYFSESF